MFKITNTPAAPGDYYPDPDQIRRRRRYKYYTLRYRQAINRHEQ